MLPIGGAQHCLAFCRSGLLPRLAQAPTPQGNALALQRTDPGSWVGVGADPGATFQREGDGGAGLGGWVVKPPKELWAMSRVHWRQTAQSAERKWARQWPIRP